MRSATLAMVWAAALACPCARGQQAETVGRIEGTTFTASGQVRVTREAGHNTTTLLSGSDVVVHEGHARLTLADGSELDVCGPAKISLLKSGGALTVALDYGRVHGRLAPALEITVFTALATATPVSIGSGQRDVVVGLEQQGALCVNAVLGAVRLEHQLTGERVLAPQGSELTVPASSLNAISPAPGVCRCDAPPEPVIVGVPKPEPAKPVVPPPPAKPAEVTRSQESAQAERPREEPRVVAVMPPLSFDAKNPNPRPATRPEVVRIIREARVAPATVYRGRVEPRAPATDKKSESANGSDKAAETEKEKKPGFGTRLKNFFRRLFGGKPKQ